MPDKIRKEPALGIKDVFAHLKEGHRRCFLYDLNLALMVLGVFALGVYFPDSLYLTIPLILIPWMYASMLMILDKRANDSSAPSLFFRSFTQYFRPGPLGSYRVIRNYFISLGFAVLASFLTGIIYYVVAPRFDPAFNDAINEMLGYINMQNTEALRQFFDSNASFRMMIDVISIVDVAVFFFLFTHKIGLYGPNAMLRTTSYDPRSNMNQLYVKTIRSDWRGFYRHYAKMFWPFLILELGGMVGGYFLGGLIPTLGVAQRMVFGAGLASFLLALCFGYYVTAIDLLRKPFGEQMMAFIFEASEQVINDPRMAERLTPEQMEEMKQELEEARKEMEEMRKNGLDDNVIDEPPDNDDEIDQ